MEYHSKNLNQWLQHYVIMVMHLQHYPWDSAYSSHAMPFLENDPTCGIFAKEQSTARF
jgi:hypothetical protein